MARVTLGGEELAGFAAAAPADHVRVFFPARGRDPVLPTVFDGRPRMHADVDPHRDYTVRAFRPKAGQLDIDIVLHDEGVATAWALGAALRAVGLPEGRGYVWVAGETGAVAPLRGYVRDELGIAADRFDVDGYWRRGHGGQERFGPVRES